MLAAINCRRMSREGANTVGSNKPDAARLVRMLRPRRVAILGGSWADEVARQCVQVGFDGELWRVHERARDLPNQVSQYSCLSDLPAAADVVFLGVSADATLQLLPELRAADTGGAVCFAAGFDETLSGGIAGKQQLLIDAAGDMPLLGPNCYGYLNYLDGVAMWPDQQPSTRVDSGVALITQSGNLGVNATFQQRSLPLAYLLSVGNQAVLGIADLMHAMLDDKRVTAIGMYVEGIDDGAAFRVAVERARDARVPVVVIKAGRTQSAANAAAGHTASIAGDDAVFDAFCARYGLARVASMAELIETLKLLHVHGPLAGKRVATLSCSGGEAVMVSDLGEPLGLEFPPLPQASKTRLRAVLGERVHLTNPLDYQTYIWGDEALMKACYGAVLEADYDAVGLLLDFPDPDHYDLQAWEPAPNAFVYAANGALASNQAAAAAVVIANLPESMPASLRQLLLAAGVAPLQGLPEALAALRHAARIGEVWRMGVDDVATAVEIAGERAPALDADEYDLKQWLKTFDVLVPDGRRVRIKDAGETAERLPGPWVVKTAARLAHKSDVGGVALGLETRAAVQAAADRMRVHGTHVLVESMQPQVVVDLLVSVRRDPMMGLTLVVAAGGIFVELFGQAELELLPVSPARVDALLRRLPIFPLLQGYRGCDGANINSVRDTILGLCGAASSLGDALVELEVNPVLATVDRAVVADALLSVSASAQGHDHR